MPDAPHHYRLGTTFGKRWIEITFYDTEDLAKAVARAFQDSEDFGPVQLVRSTKQEVAL